MALGVVITLNVRFSLLEPPEAWMGIQAVFVPRIVFLLSMMYV